MPNHCYNFLEISADPSNRKALKQLADFKDKSIVIDEDSIHNRLRFTFNGAYPMPEELNVRKGYPPTEEEKAQYKSNIEKYGYSDWYEWRIANWGTKWDAYDYYVNEDDMCKDYCAISFDTAWSPPIQYYEKLSETYPLLTIEVEYSEAGMDFAGTQTYENGELTSETEMTYGKWEFIENNDSWWDCFYDNIENQCYGDLEDFQNNHEDIWGIMNKDDKRLIKKAFKEYKNEKTNS